MYGSVQGGEERDLRNENMKNRSKIRMCVCVCVCVREREREVPAGGKQKGTDEKKE